jgi:hypothetical protein
MAELLDVEDDIVLEGKLDCHDCDGADEGFLLTLQCEFRRRDAQEK